MGRSTSLIAPEGQTRAQPPQPWHSSGETNTFVPIQTIALNRQMSPQAPQRVQLSGATCGVGRPTARVAVISGLRKMWPLGSSTSQSTYTARAPFRAAIVAKLAAMVVLPVPPLPLATAIRTGLVSSVRAAAVIHCGVTAASCFSKSLAIGLALELCDAFVQRSQRLLDRTDLALDIGQKRGFLRLRPVLALLLCPLPTGEAGGVELVTPASSTAPEAHTSSATEAWNSLGIGVSGHVVAAAEACCTSCHGALTPRTCSISSWHCDAPF